jgi:hypothetical protein
MTQRRENIVIAHRGNQEGPCPQWENHPEYIQTALNAGFHVEVDVRLSRYSADHCMLGHGPTDKKYEVPIKWLEDSRLWCHAKDVKTFATLLRNDQINCFFIQDDACTVTSKGFLWQSPPSTERLAACDWLSRAPEFNAICVMPESMDWDMSYPVSYHNCLGICTDYPIMFRKEIEIIHKAEREQMRQDIDRAIELHRQAPPEGVIVTGPNHEIRALGAESNIMLKKYTMPCVWHRFSQQVDGSPRLRETRRAAAQLWNAVEMSEALKVVVDPW